MSGRIALIALIVAVTGCEFIPTSPPLDLKTAQVLAAAKMLADSDRLDEPDFVANVLGTSFTMQERHYIGTDAHPEECDGHPDRTAHGTARTYTAASEIKFKGQSGPEVDPVKVHYDINFRTTCGGRNSGPVPELTATIELVDVGRFTCISPQTLNTAFRHLRQGIIFDAGWSYAYESERRNVLLVNKHGIGTPLAG